MRYLALSLPLFFLLCIGAVRTEAKDSDASPLEIRIEITERQDHFMLKLYLKNPTATDIVLEVGRGGVGKQVSPFLRCAFMSVSPRNFLGPPRASMRPDPLCIPSKGEVLYDTYFVGYPKVMDGAKKLSVTISFREFGDRTKKHELKTTGELKRPKTNKAIGSDKK